MTDLRMFFNEESVEAMAKICHDANRSYCQTIDDNTQVPWEEAPEWQKESARKGVLLHLSGDHGPEASHKSWMKEKLDTGWKYGPVKNPEKKEHPCLVPFEKLDAAQQGKDFLFLGIVKAFKDATDPLFFQENQ